MCAAGVSLRLVELLSLSEEAQEVSAAALSNIVALVAGARDDAVIRGAIEPLVRILRSSESEHVLGRAAAALGIIAAGSPSNKAAIIGLGTVPLVNRMLGHFQPGSFGHNGASRFWAMMQF